MKKAIIILVSALLFSACGNVDESEVSGEISRADGQPTVGNTSDEEQSAKSAELPTALKEALAKPEDAELDDLDVLLRDVARFDIKEYIENKKKPHTDPDTFLEDTFYAQFTSKDGYVANTMSWFVLNYGDYMLVVSEDLQRVDNEDGSFKENVIVGVRMFVDHRVPNFWFRSAWTLRDIDAEGNERKVEDYTKESLLEYIDMLDRVEGTELKPGDVHPDAPEPEEQTVSG